MEVAYTPKTKRVVHPQPARFVDPKVGPAEARERVMGLIDFIFHVWYLRREFRYMQKRGKEFEVLLSDRTCWVATGYDGTHWEIHDRAGNKDTVSSARIWMRAEDKWDRK